MQLRGRERVTRTVRIAKGSETLILARERGLDVTLEVTDAGKLIARSDDPIRRTGIQRATFSSSRDADYVVSLVGKENAGVHGSVDLRVLTLPATSDQCLQIQRMLATASSAYASGQAVSRGEATQGALDAASAYRSAAASYKGVATRLGAIRAPALLAQTQHALAVLYDTDLEIEVAEAKTWAESAAKNYGAAGDAYGKARAQAVEAYATFELAVSPQSPSATADALSNARQGLIKARTLLLPIVQFHARRGEKDDQASALNTTGLTYYEEGSNEDAIRAFQQALTLYEGLGDTLGRAKLLHNIALAETDLGRLTSAAARYAQVLQLITAQDDPYGYTYVLIANGVASWASGDVDTALQRFGQALELARKIQNTGQQGRALYHLGLIYDTLGDAGLALDFYRQALPLRRAESEGPGRIATLSAIANILRARGESAEALKTDREALSLAAGTMSAARFRVRIARDLQALGHMDEAMQELETVLAPSSGANEPQRGEALLERGRVRLAAHDLRRAEADLRAAIKVSQKYEAPGRALDAYVMLGRVQRAQGRTNDALSSLDKALALAEEVRAQSANPELRATVMQPLRPAFDLKITLLAERFFGGSASAAAEALTISEQARARALVDFQDMETRDIPAALAQRRQTLYRELAAHRFQLESRLDDLDADDPRLASLRGETNTLRQELDRINSEISASSKAARSSQNPVAELTRQTSVAADTAIIEYWLGSETALAWVITRERLSLVRVGTTPEVGDAARAFHSALSKLGSVPATERIQRAERLADLIIAPIAPLIAGKRTLIFAPDGALHYVPFAALRTKEAGQRRFLVEAHDVAVTPSLRFFLEPPRRDSGARPQRQMLLVDDPVYESTDTRLKSRTAATTVRPRNTPWSSQLRGGTSSSLRRLPASAREAATIAALLPTASIDRLEGFAATRDAFLRAPLGQYRFIHVASHAMTDSMIPQLSSLILSTVDAQGKAVDGRVMAADFMEHQLRADAVVLSACDTALGANVAGEGLIGLRYVVLARGARSVLASLWQVPDQAAMQLMTNFYGALLRDKTSLIAASSNAMRAQLKTDMTDPAWWAAFTLTVRSADRGSERVDP